MHVNRREVVTGATALALMPRALSNADASAEARALYGYIWSIYGTRTLTGQREQNFTAAGARVELDYIQTVTGPAARVTRARLYRAGRSTRSQRARDHLVTLRRDRQPLLALGCAGHRHREMPTMAPAVAYRIHGSAASLNRVPVTTADAGSRRAKVR